MQLTEKQKRHLRGLGHALKPVVITGGAGITDGVIQEVEGAITHHELIKVRVNADDRDLRDAMIAEICTKTNAQLVQRIGNIALLFRRNPDKQRVELPKA